MRPKLQCDITQIICNPNTCSLVSPGSQVLCDIRQMWVKEQVKLDEYYCTTVYYCITKAFLFDFSVAVGVRYNLRFPNSTEFA